MARSTGALRRARDITDAEVLLRLLRMQVANGYSLAETAVRARQFGMRLSAVAVCKRLRASAGWLRWLAEQQRGTQPVIVASQGRVVRAVDATTVSEPGRTGTGWRVPYALNLAHVQGEYCELTGAAGGATVRRVPVRRGDLLVGGRVDATPLGVAPVPAREADLVVRWKRPSLPLFTLAENRIDPLRLFRRLKVGPPPWSAPVQPPRGGGVRGRWLARQRSAEATRLARRRLERKARQRPKKRSRECWDAAPYVAVGTTLRAAFPAAGVLAL